MAGGALLPPKLCRSVELGVLPLRPGARGREGSTWLPSTSAALTREAWSFQADGPKEAKELSRLPPDPDT